MTDTSVARDPMMPVITGPTEIIDKDDTAVDAQDYSKSVSISLGETVDCEVVEITLITSELNAGAIMTPAGTLYIFDTDPEISSGDTALAAAAAEHKTATIIKVAATDWDSDSNGGIAVVTCTRFFRNVSTLYVAFRPDAGETTINSGATDDEEMHIMLKYIKYNRQ